MADTMNCPSCGARVSPQPKEGGGVVCPECGASLEGLEGSKGR